MLLCNLPIMFMCCLKKEKGITILFPLLESLTSKGVHVMVKQSTVAETVRLNRLRWFGYVQRMEENRTSPKSIKYEFGNNKAER